MNHNLIFPKKFLWGTATSSHQIEGNNTNNWWEWEHLESRIKDLKSKNKNPQDYISGEACNHYHSYEKDFDLIKDLNNNAYRFSIEWSRIEPEEGKFNQKEIDHYKKVLIALRKRGIIPFVTLYHWTIPLWFKEKGGWLNPKSLEYFGRYVKKVVENLKEHVDFWITINEPLIYSVHSYLIGKFPPQEKSLFKTIKAVKNLVKAHKKSYAIIHRLDKNAKVSIAKSGTFFDPYKNKLFNKVLAKILCYFWNDYFLNSIEKEIDFIGLNYYFHNRIRGSWTKKGWLNQNENREVSDMRWEIYPKGIYWVLKKFGKYRKPIYITENGIADAKDGKRANFIIQHLKWIHKAIQEGIDIRGYFYWSLLDNFEWSEGFWPRFGLIEVDYKTQKRIIRESAKVYAKICKNNSIVV